MFYQSHQLDAIFMPVQKVDFKIDYIYGNNKIINENLILDISTNGSINPHDAIVQSSELIIGLFNQIITNKSSIDETNEDIEISVLPPDTQTHISIEELQLSVRAYNCLKRAQINSED
jgi:DNA-directed RNA polymerase subunit alpha